MSRQTTLEHLSRCAPVIAPSMLKCDFGNLHREVELLEAAGAELLHLDVMDGHFVPNLSYGPMVIRSLRRLTKIPFDAHLMISEPERYLDEYLDAGCDAVTFHVEASSNPVELLRRIREADAVAGLALNPGTSVETVEPFLGECDLVLVMSVEPGLGGQSFIPASIDKLERLRKMLPADVLLSVDGGIGSETIEETAAAGADVFVAGSAIFDQPDYGLAIKELTELANRATCSSGSRNQ
jgi:ribulose-phosphate 3-epimerase